MAMQGVSDLLSMPDFGSATQPGTTSATTRQQQPEKINATGVVLPPEGVEWADRWAELENAMAALEVDRDALKAEVTQLRQQKVDQALIVLETNAASTVDSKELDKMQSRFDEARKQADSLLSELVKERDRGAILSEELQNKANLLSTLSKEKLQLQYEKNDVASELLPVSEERDRLRKEKSASTTTIEQLRDEVAQLIEERNKMFQEKASLRRDLTCELEAARGDASFHQKVAEEAREQQEQARQKVLAAEQGLKDKVLEFAQGIAELEAKLNVRGERLERANESLESSQKELAQVKNEKQAALDAHAALETEHWELKDKCTQFEKELANVKREQEDLLRRRVPGAEGAALPDGYASLSQLVLEVKVAREEAINQRHAKEKLQTVLQEVEQEVRSRYPALLSQREDADRLRKVAEQLTQQNEGLLSQVQYLEEAKREADLQVRQASRSSQILEAHARDMQKQLAVLVVQNQRLQGIQPKLPPGMSDLEALEADRKYFRTVQDLTEQNESLRKLVARLTKECETSAQLELQAIRKEQDQQVEEWKKHLGEKAEQMKALVDTVERLTNERDEAQHALKQLQATPPASQSVGPQPAKDDGALREQLSVVREEFTKYTQVLQKEIQELRGSESKTRQDLVKAQAQLDFEMVRTKDLNSSLQQAEKRLEERLNQLRSQEKRNASLEESLQKEESSARDLEALLGQAKRDQGKIKMQLKQETEKVAALEAANRSLLAERASHSQLTVDLQARLAQETDTYREMKKDLETHCKQREDLLREQITLSEQRQTDLKRTVEELSTAHAAHESEMTAARKKASELEVTKTRLETQLAERTAAFEELRAAGATHPRRGVDVAAEAEAQLGRSQVPRQERSADVAKFEQQLRFAREREEEDKKQAEIWQALLANHEDDLKKRGEEIKELQKELAKTVDVKALIADELEAAQGKADKLEERIQTLGKEAADFHAQLAQKDKEIAAAKKEGEQHAREAVSRAQNIERENASSKDVVSDLQNRVREAVTAHAQDIKLLEGAQKRNADLTAELHAARKNIDDLDGEANRARAERTDELTSLQKRLQHAEQHSKALADECKKYQEHLVALSEVKGISEDTNEVTQRIASEMKRAREMGELQRQELELDRARLERETKSARREAADLQRRLDSEQQEVLRLQAEIRREERALAKLNQLGMLEDENRRVMAEAKSLEAKLEDAHKELQGKKSVMEPLEHQVREGKKKEEEWEKTRAQLEAQADESRKMYESMVVRFDKNKINELDKLKEESSKWSSQMADLNKKFEKAQEELKNAKQESTQCQTLKGSNEELQKQLLEAKDSLERIKKEKQQLVELKAKKDQEVTQVESKKKLAHQRIEEHEKMIAHLQEQLKKSSEEKKKIQADAEKSTSRAAASAEEEKKAAHARADKMLALTQKYQQGCQSLIAQRAAEEERAREAQEKAMAKTQSEGKGSASSPLVVVEEDKEVSETGKRKQAETASASPVARKAATLISSTAQAAKDRPTKVQRVTTITDPGSEGESRPALTPTGSSSALAGAGLPPATASSTVSPKGQLGTNVAAAKKALTTPTKAAPRQVLQLAAASPANTPGSVSTLTGQSESQATPAASAVAAVATVADKDSSTIGAASETVVPTVDMVVDLEQESGL